MRRLWWLVVTGCGASDLPIDQLESTLNASERLARCEVIRDVARDRGLTNGVVLGGIGDAETGLAHCWSEATWACQGPESSSCGGPVIAGAGDGPCSARQGGLGLFQFDGGTFDETLARDGEEILLLEGNVSHAVDFVLGMVVRSQYVDIGNSDDALAWINSIPIEPGNPDYEAWISTVTHYYNGCQPTFGCWDERRGRYESLTRGVYEEMGADFWMAPAPQPCLPIPAEGRIIEENDPCYDDSGPIASWRTADAGHGGRLRWTFAFDQPRENFAAWNLELAAEGNYLVEVYTDAEYAQSKQARYTITHAGTTDEVLIDQSAVDGFQPLGTFFFAAGGGQSILLDDNTGEPLSAQLRLAFDAIRLTPAAPEQMLVPVPSREAIDLDGDGKPDVMDPEPVDPDAMGMMVEEGGCVCVRSKGESSLLLLPALLLFTSRRLARSLVRPARDAGLPRAPRVR